MNKCDKLIRKDNSLVSEPAFQDILQGVVSIIEQSRQSVAVYVNQEMTMMHWHVGKFVLRSLIAAEHKNEDDE